MVVKCYCNWFYALPWCHLEISDSNRRHKTSFFSTKQTTVTFVVRTVTASPSRLSRPEVSSPTEMRQDDVVAFILSLGSVHICTTCRLVTTSYDVLVTDVTHLRQVWYTQGSRFSEQQFRDLNRRESFFVTVFSTLFWINDYKFRM